MVVNHLAPNIVWLITLNTNDVHKDVFQSAILNSIPLQQQLSASIM